MFHFLHARNYIVTISYRLQYTYAQEKPNGKNNWATEASLTDFCISIDNTNDPELDGSQSYFMLGAFVIALSLTSLQAQLPINNS